MLRIRKTGENNCLYLKKTRWYKTKAYLPVYTSIQIKSLIVYISTFNISCMLISEIILKQNPYLSPKYEAAYKRSMEDPEGFWAEVGQSVTWTKPWDKVLDNSDEPFTKW